jgi:hypothetical protein
VVVPLQIDDTTTPRDSFNTTPLVYTTAHTRRDKDNS